MRKSQTAPHTRWRWVLIGLVILASALLLAATACGGDNGGNDKTGADASATPAEGTPGASQISEEVSKKLRDLGEEWAKTSVKATFTIAMTDTAMTDTDTTGSTVTLYRAPPKVRMDISDETEGINMIVISTPDKTYVCSQEGGDQCLAYPPSSNVADVPAFLSLVDPGAIEAELSGLTGNVQIASSSEKVAGNDASCVSAEGNIGGEDSFIKWCFATNGLLLFIYWADAAGTSEWTLEATDVGTVSDSDFEPPYPVSEAPESPTPTATPGG